LQNNKVISIQPWIIILLYFSGLFGIFQVFSIFGYGFGFVDSFMLVIYSIVLVKYVLLNEKFKVYDPYLTISIFTLILSVYLSGIGLFFWASEESYLQFIKTILHFTYVGLFGIVVLAIDISYKTIYYSIKTLLISSIFINAYGIYQLFARIFFLPFAYFQVENDSFLTRDFSKEFGEAQQVVLNFDNFYRATSIFSEPLALAWFNIFCLVFLITPYFSKNQELINNKALKVIVLVLLIIGLFLSFSLTGVVLIVLLLTSIIIIEKIQKTRVFKAFISVVVVLFATDSIQQQFTGVSVSGLFVQRISGLLSIGEKGVNMTYGESAPDRINSISNATNLFLEQPITGIGAGNTYYYPTSTSRFAQSSFFHILSEGGLVGITALMFLFYHLIKAMNFLKNNRHLHRRDKPILASLATGSYYLGILIIFTTIFTGNQIGNYSFWYNLAVLLIIYRESMKITIENKL